MAAGLGLTGGIAMFASTSPALISFVFGTRFVFLGLIIAELVIVGFLSARVFAWSLGKVQAAFVGYAMLNGITLSCVFLAYTSSSIASTFFVTAGTFGVMSLFGYFTKADLSGWGKMLSMALIGLVIAMVVNMFLNSSVLQTVTSFIGVLLFVALTAYDTQKLKQMALAGRDGRRRNEQQSFDTRGAHAVPGFREPVPVYAAPVWAAAVDYSTKVSEADFRLQFGLRCKTPRPGGRGVFCERR